MIKQEMARKRAEKLKKMKAEKAAKEGKAKQAISQSYLDDYDPKPKKGKFAQSLQSLQPNKAAKSAVPGSRVSTQPSPRAASGVMNRPMMSWGKMTGNDRFKSKFSKSAHGLPTKKKKKGNFTVVNLNPEWEAARHSRAVKLGKKYEGRLAKQLTLKIEKKAKENFIEKVRKGHRLTFGELSDLKDEWKHEYTLELLEANKKQN